MINAFDLCSGIGGFRLGFQRAGGFRFIAHAEINDYADAVYVKRFPDSPNLGDLMDRRHSMPSVLDSESRPSGRGAGSMADNKPDIILLESAPGWRGRGLGRTLRDLASLGFDAEWFTLCPCLFGAPHCRPRVFVLAYSDRKGEPFRALHEKMAGLPALSNPISWQIRPVRLGVANGIPSRVDRLRVLGNAVMPCVTEWIAGVIKDA